MHMNKSPKNSKLKKPALGYKKNESYTDAHMRWRRRIAEYRDACVMADCCKFGRKTKRGRMLRGFYGLTVGELKTVDAYSILR